MVDALGSGPSGGNTVEVRVLSWAPDSKREPPTGGSRFCEKLGGPIHVCAIESFGEWDGC